MERKGIPMWAIVAGVVAAILLLVICPLGNAYNGLVNADLAVENTWAEIQVQYQRRFDAVSTQVQIVGAAANQEQTIFDILRQQNQQANELDQLLEGYSQNPPQGAEAEELLRRLQEFDASYQASQAQFLVYVADNPEITSMPLYEDLLVTVEGSENRIAIARRDYNTAVNDMKGRLRRFPGNLVAGLFGFTEADYKTFTAAEGTSQPPPIVFPTPAVQ